MILLISLLLLAGTIFVEFNKKKNKTKQPNYKNPSWQKVPNVFIGIKLGSKANIADILEGWARQYGQQGVFETRLLFQRFYVICSEKAISQLEQKRPYVITRRKNLVSAFNSIGADGLFSAEGDTWKKDRRIVAPSLNHKNVEKYVSKIQLVAGRLVEKWSNIIDKDPDVQIAINDDVILSAVDVISLVAFAKDLNTITRGGGELSSVLAKLFEIMMIRTVMPIKYYKIPFIGQHLDGGYKLKKYVVDLMQNVVDDFKHNNNEDKSATFLGRMIEFNKKTGDDSMSMERFVGNLLTMFGAGSETTASTLTMCLYEIAKDTTGLQNELYYEMSQMASIDDADLDAYFTSLPRLRSLVYEVLRLKGPTPIFGVENVEPVEIDGITIPTGSYFMFLHKYITEVESFDESTGKGTRKGLLNTPIHEFCARRWLKQDEEGQMYFVKPTFATGFRTFGSGLRICPGKELAEVEILVFLAFILREFEISLSPNHPKITMITQLAQRANEDICLTMKKRKTKDC